MSLSESDDGIRKKKRKESKKRRVIIYPSWNHTPVSTGLDVDFAGCVQPTWFAERCYVDSRCVSKVSVLTCDWLVGSVSTCRILPCAVSTGYHEAWKKVNGCFDVLIFDAKILLQQASRMMGGAWKEGDLGIFVYIKAVVQGRTISWRTEVSISRHLSSTSLLQGCHIFQWIKLAARCRNISFEERVAIQLIVVSIGSNPFRHLKSSRFNLFSLYNLGEEAEKVKHQGILRFLYEHFYGNRSKRVDDFWVEYLDQRSLEGKNPLPL